MNLLGKKAIVTGAARGIGRGCALELARAGADVVINDLRQSDDSDATVSEIRAFGRTCELIEGDVFARAGCESLVTRAIAVLGRIDILVSNPAFSRRADFVDADPDDFERVITGTLLGGFHLSQLVARQMIAQGTGGKIVFISSVHAEIPYVRSAAYNAGKAGLNHMAKTIAAELLPHRINVNVIEPGWIDTPGEHATFGDAFIAEQAAKLPWKRLGQPADIGKAATFLCSDDADYITGTTLVVDGGFLLRAALS